MAVNPNVAKVVKSLSEVSNRVNSIPDIIPNEIHKTRPRIDSSKQSNNIDNDNRIYDLGVRKPGPAFEEIQV
jgi:hypothetical protein